MPLATVWPIIFCLNSNELLLWLAPVKSTILTLLSNYSSLQ